MNVSVESAPGAIVPSVHIMAELPTHDPPIVELATRVNPVGSVSVIIAYVDVEGPRLVTVSVYVSEPPAGTESELDVFAIDRSAIGEIVAEADAELLLVLASDEEVVADAVLVIVPTNPVSTFVFTVTTALEFAARSPTTHVTV